MSPLARCRKALDPAPLPPGPRPWFKFPAPSGGTRPLAAGHQLPSSAGTAEPLSVRSSACSAWACSAWPVDARPRGGPCPLTRTRTARRGSLLSSFNDVQHHSAAGCATVRIYLSSLLRRSNKVVTVLPPPTFKVLIPRRSSLARFCFQVAGPGGNSASLRGPGAWACVIVPSQAIDLRSIAPGADPSPTQK